MSDEYLEAVAMGVYALQAKIWQDPRESWRQLPDRERSRFRARARFVLSYADASAMQAGRA